MREPLSFACAGDTLAGTLDRGARDVGLLIVSGGNEIAIGPQRAMARLAKRVADAGWPVFRFDRRGVGDSSGTNRGYASSAPDIRAARDRFARRGARHIVAFGNCDAATALALHDFGRPFAARVLANPWLDLGCGDLPPAAAIRRHYRQRLTDPAAWRALLTGRIDLGKARRGLRQVAAPAPAIGLAQEFAAALRARPAPTRIVLAERDATGIAFADAWRDPRFDDLRAGIRIDRIPTAAHGFTADADLHALATILIETLAGVASMVEAVSARPDG